MSPSLRTLLGRIPGLRRCYRLLASIVEVRRTINPHAKQVAFILSWPRRLAGASESGALPKIAIPQDGGASAVKLNIGGGKGHPRVDGWTVIDLRERTADLVLDVTKDPLPFRDGSVGVIFTSHTLEHLYPQRLEFVLREFHRALCPDTGLLRIAVPDIELAIRAYREKDYLYFANSEVGQFDEEAPIGGLLASWFYSTRVFKDPDLRHGEGHVHCFDYEYMAYWLRRCGFKRVWRSAYRQSALPELRGAAFDRHQQDSLFVEAMKSPPD